MYSSRSSRNKDSSNTAIYSISMAPRVTNYDTDDDDNSDDDGGEYPITLRANYYTMKLRNCPNNDGSTYCNYKHAHSVVLMAICDAHYVFRFVDIGAYGRRSDGGIFSNNAIGKNFNTNVMNIPKLSAVAGGRILPYCLVGDEAFPLKPYLLRPYPGKNGLTSHTCLLVTDVDTCINFKCFRPLISLFLSLGVQSHPVWPLRV
ncbi:hypothetical protein ALC57_00261 [Trachymyrmex cornetzi]|uniref:DDE Tnp4 domain-containing protein n=1 Tax=Trachymyrmex cornetzi TaxID=471704 RepID=A0A151JSL3_9HYME|nr:hypothetical protein ALC57_00261 [Trachymyrmex cornetzi]